MKSTILRTYAFWIFSALAVGILSGLLTGTGTKNFSDVALQPSFAPPPVVFPIVWTLLYTLMGISAARIALMSSSPATKKGLNLYVAQLIVNFFWSLIFFNADAYGFSVLWMLLLLSLVLLMVLQFQKADPPAAILQIPYLLWLAFALVLNIRIWQLNR